MLKTLKCKIALVAVAALGAGGLALLAAPVAFKLASHASPMLTLAVHPQVLHSETHETGAKIICSLGLLG